MGWHEEPQSVSLTHRNSILQAFTHLLGKNLACYPSEGGGITRTPPQCAAETPKARMKEQVESPGQDWRSKSTLPQPNKPAAANKLQQALPKFRKRKTCYRQTTRESPQCPYPTLLKGQVLIPPSKHEASAN